MTYAHAQITMKTVPIVTVIIMMIVVFVPSSVVKEKIESKI